MKTSYLLILIFLAKMMAGQHDSFLVHKNQLKISPLRVWGMDPGLELSYERQISEKFSAQVTARYITDLLKNTPQHSYKNLNGMAVYIEPKYYYCARAHSRMFFSLRAGYLNCRFENVDDFINIHADSTNDLQRFIVDTVSIERHTLDLNLNGGIQKYYKRFVFEFSVGLGVRYRSVKLTDKLYEDSEMWRHRHEFTIPMHRDGSFFVPNLPVRLKIGYCF